MPTPNASRSWGSLGTVTRMSWRVAAAIAAMIIFGPAFLFFNVTVVAFAASFALLQSQQLRILRVSLTTPRRERSDNPEWQQIGSTSRTYGIPPGHTSSHEGSA